nr:uncharacterized protein LOC112726555 [Arachis hypogaea]
MTEARSDKDRTEEDNRGRNVILLEEVDISEGINACSNSLYGRLFASKTFSVGTMENALKAIWENPEGFSDYVLYIKRWKEDQNSDEEIVSNFSVWVQFWGLLESFKTLEVGRKLGERLGTVLEVGKFHMRGRETRIVKAKLNIEATKKVRDQLIVVGPNKKEVEVALHYERLGKFCTYCAKLGHEVKNCHDLLKDTESDRVKEDDIGEWVKANQDVNAEEEQSLKRQNAGNKAALESPQSANSRTECMEVIIVGQSNAKEDEGKPMQFTIGQFLTTEKGRK